MTEPIKPSPNIAPVSADLLAINQSLGLWFEGDAHRVDAVAISGWSLRGIVKDVAQVTAALLAANLGANHAVGFVLDVFDGLVVLRLIERGPTAVGVKLGVGNKQKGVAATAVVAALALLI